MEAAGFSTLLDNTDDVYKTLLKCGYKIDQEFCEDIFKIWRTEFNSSERHLPFRINTAKKTCKLARCYFRDNLIKELTSICNKYGYDIVINAKSLHTIKIGNKSIQEGDGSVFGNRANRGLGFETELQTYIINYIKKVLEEKTSSDRGELSFVLSRKVSRSILPTKTAVSPAASEKSLL